jgi:hypothetical protein
MTYRDLSKGETKAPPRYQMSKASDTQDPNPTSKELDTQDLNLKFLKWRRTDHLAKGWLIATLFEDVLGIVVGLNTAIEVWNSLVHAFS